MSTQFKFDKEVEPFKEQFYDMDSDSTHNLGKLVFCHFTGVKEQTHNEEERPFGSKFKHESLPHKRDQRCYFNGNSLKIYSRGGSEYIIPMHFKVEAVYPIEDGLIVKTAFNRDLLYFDPFYSPSSLQDEEYTYMTISTHPLNDIHPLSLGGKSDLIQTHLDILFVSYKIPLVLFHNKQTKKLVFALLKKRNEDGLVGPDFEDEEKYIRTIEPESRNADIFNLSKEYEVYLQEIQSVDCVSPPSKIFLSKDLQNSHDLHVSLFYKELQKTDIWSMDLRQMNSLRLSSSYAGICDAVQLNFSQQKYLQHDKMKVVSSALAHSLLDQQEYQQNPPKQLKVLKRRIKTFTKDLVLLDQQKKNLIFVSGLSNILTIDTTTLYDESPVGRSTILDKTQKVIGLLNPSNSSVSLQLSDGSKERLKFNYKCTDFLVQSIMHSFKQFLPAALFENLNKDLIELISRCSLEPSKVSTYDLYSDQFTKVSNILLTLLTGESNFMSSKASQIFAALSQPISGSIQSQQTSHQQNQAGAKPVTALQTKILRSSTTSFGVDPNAIKRKVQPANTAAQLIQQHQQISSQAQRPSAQFSKTVIGTSSLNQTRRMTSGSTEVQSVTNSLQAPQNQGFTPISQNPFADLLNSDFHKDMFGSQFSNLFSDEVKFSSPTIPAQEVPSQIISSPIKGKTPSSQKVSSIKQSTIVSSGTHERKNSQSISSVPAQHVPLLSLKTNRHEFLIHAKNIFLVLHLMYENLKLNKARDAVESPKLAKLLFKWAMASDPFKKAGFIEYYLNEHSELRSEFEADIRRVFKGNSIIQSGVEIEVVPKLYKWLESQLRRSQSKMHYPFPLFFDRTRKIVRLYEILCNSQPNSFLTPLLSVQRTKRPIDFKILDNLVLNCELLRSSVKSQNLGEYLMMSPLCRDLHLFEKILFCLKEENQSLDDVKKLPGVISLPILEVIRYSRLFQQEVQSIPQWPDSLYKLIQREDILNNMRILKKSQPGGSSQPHAPTPSVLDYLRQGSKTFALNREVSNVFDSKDIEDVKEDQYVKELESSIKKTAADLITSDKQDGEGEGSQKSSGLIEFLKNRFSSDTRYKEVLNLLNSSSEMIIKMEHIQNKESMPEERLTQEKNSLLDKMFLRNLSKCVGRGALVFGTMQTIPTETLQIPKINQTAFIPMSEAYMSVEFKDDASKDLLQWPDFHNGASSALRIAQSFINKKEKSQSHTRNWIMYHKPSEPKYDHGGFILAMGLLGQLDSLQPTDIYQHLKTTHDATAIGVLLGRAASKIGSMDDHDTRTLCIHIPYLLPPTLSIEISLSIQSAAVIGAGLLYKGTSNRLMTEMLLAQIGRKPLSDKAIEREGYALASGIALGLVNLGIGNEMLGLSDLKLDERLIRYVEGGKIIDLPQSMLSTNFNHDNTKCSSIKEGDMVNVHITSQGALVALALIHLKSNNETIANSLLMPQTFFSLESVRPSFLLLKVLCKNLIMWDKMQCTREWVKSQVPEIIREIYGNDIATVEKKFQQKQIEDGIDYSTVALCYVNIIAGAIFSLGFKYAGTGNKAAFKLIQEFSEEFRKKMRIVQSNKDSIGVVHTDQTKNQIDKNTVETALCVSAFAMSMVMAGTGDIDCFRALRVLRKRFEHDMHYGYNMAIHMSLGFLFLGSGVFTLSTSNLSIASLLCSLYPVFPSHPGDNRYHLQALRHFYVLAIETRLLQARDIDTGEFVNIEMKVSMKEDNSSTETTQVLSTPAIINGKLLSVEVNSEEYHSVKIDLSSSDIESQVSGITANSRGHRAFDNSDRQKVIYVKSKGNSNTPTLKITDLKPRISEIQEVEIQDGQQHQILDPSIKVFQKYFANRNEAHLSKFSDIEDVLLAQARDPFSSLSVQEFFRIQDLFEQISEQLEGQVTESNLNQKKKIQDAINECYLNDKLEAVKIFVEMARNQSHQHNYSSTLAVYENRLLQAYSAFSKDSMFVKQEMSDFGLIQSCVQTQEESLDLQESLKVIRSLGEQSITAQSSSFNTALLGMELNEIQIAKFVIEEILRSLSNSGEGDLVKSYIDQRTSGAKLEGAFKEINESIKMSINQIFKFYPHQSVQKDEVLIQGLFQMGNIRTA